MSNRAYWVLILIFTLIAGPTAAQTLIDAPPVRETVDKNGIDLIGGNLTLSATDVSIGPSGPHGLALTRYWSVNGWSDTQTGGISGSTSNPVVTFAGASDSFTLQNGTYVADQGNGATLTFNSGSGDYYYTSRDGLVVRFTASGSYYAYNGPQANVAYLRSVTYPDGAVATYTWKNATVCFSPDGMTQLCASFIRLQSVANNFGYMLKFGYQSNSLNTINDANAWSTRVQAIAINTQVDGCDPSADSCSLAHSWPTVAYDAVFPTAVTDPAGRVSHYTYGQNSLGIRRPGASSDDVTITYDSNSRVQSVAKLGSSWTYAYAATGNANEQQTTVTNPDGTHRTLVVDTGIGRPKTTTDETNATSSFTYDANGRLTLATVSDGNSVEYTYDSAGRGNVIQTTLHPKPNMNVGMTISTTAYYDPGCASPKICNQPIWTRDANGNQTDYSYDAGSGLPTVVTAPAGANGVRPQARYSYTVSNGVTLLSSTSTCRTQSSCSGTADESRTAIGYGANLLPTAGTKAAGDNGVSATASMTYDNIGNMVTSTDPVGAVSQYVYDADREVTETISADPDGGGPLKPRAVRITYNVDGTVAEKESGTDTGGNFQSLQQVAYAYDSYGRQNRTTSTAGGTTYGVVDTDYDLVNRFTCTAVRMDPASFNSRPSACVQGTAGSDRITRINTDPLGRTTLVVEGQGTGVQVTTSTLTYTLNGKTASAIDANGNTTSYTYDGFDRPLTTTYPGGSYEQLGYDSNGNVISKLLRDGQSIGYVYDALGRLTAKNRPDNVYWETNLSYGWDNLGELVSAGDGNGHSFGFVYDALGRKTSQSDSWYATGNASFQYDATGRRTRQTWWDGQYIQFSYDLLGEMTSFAENGGPVPVAFGYDDLGRRTALYRANGASTTYGYDAASRLATMTHLGNANITWGYGYNAAGQITSRTSSNDAYAWAGAVTTDRSYAVNGLNQYTQSGATALGYDGRGNLTSSGSSSYTYTSENQLANAPGSNLAYDALGRLFNGNLDPGQNTTLSYDDDQVIVEIDQQTGAVLRRYVYGPGTDEPLIWYEGTDLSNRRYLHADERGSVAAVTDNSGNVSAINSYDEFGIPGANNVGRFQYTGQKWLPVLGMYDYKARTYSPTLGRFLQTDPIGYGDGMNWYNYTGGDPVNTTDPSGTDSCNNDDNAEAHGVFYICLSGFGGGGAYDGTPVLKGTFSLHSSCEYDYACTDILAWLSLAPRLPNLTLISFNVPAMPQSPKPCGPPSMLPHGVGASFGGSADAGIPGVAGAAANGSAGVGAFYSGNAGGSVGAFASGGAAAYAGGSSASAVRGASPVVAGASGGVGFSGFVTNAQSVQQLSGPFTTYSVNVGFGPIQGTISLSVGGGIYQLSVSPPGAGVSLGASASKLRTTTVATGGCH